MIGCFDFILHVCIYHNRMRCQLIIGGKKVGYFAMTEQQHLSIFISLVQLQKTLCSPVVWVGGKGWGFETPNFIFLVFCNLE